MAEPTAPQVTRSYLTQLERSLSGLPAEVRDEIVAGIREELDGLDAADAAARIEALGDPEFIAAEARAEASLPTVPTESAQRAETVGSTSREPGWYPVLAALLVAFGGLVIPVVGWIVGLGMVWLSKTWRLRDKWVSTLTPFVAMGLFVLVFALTTMAYQPPASEGPNSLVPGFSSVIWSSVVLVIPVNAVVGLWLLWRAKQAWTGAGQTPPEAAAPEHQPTPASRRRQASWFPPVTILLIIGGGFVLPVVGWVIGVTMLWASDSWSVRDKWLGTLTGPLALLASGVLWLGALLWLRTAGGPVDPFLLVALSGLVLPTIANVLVGIRLLRRAQPGTGQPPSGG